MNQWNWSNTSKDRVQLNLNSKIWMVNLDDFTYMLGVSQIDDSNECTTECVPSGIVETQCTQSHPDKFSFVLHWNLGLQHGWGSQFSLFFSKNVIPENGKLFSNIIAILVHNNAMHDAACLHVTLMLLHVPKFKSISQCTQNLSYDHWTSAVKNWHIIHSCNNSNLIYCKMLLMVSAL